MTTPTAETAGAATTTTTTTMSSKAPIPIPATAIIATDRFILRPLEESDAAGLAQSANDLEIVRWMRSRFPSPYTLADAEWWIAHCRAGEPPAMLQFGIFTVDPEEGERHAGSVGLEPPQGDVVYAGTRELGYYVARRCWGQGIMTEAVCKFTRWAFAQLPDLLRIEARVHADNEGSKRVLIKAGFVKEGSRRMAFNKQGKVAAEEIYGLIRSDLDA